MNNDTYSRRQSISATRVAAVLTACAGPAAIVLALTSCSAGDHGGNAPVSTAPSSVASSPVAQSPNPGPSATQSRGSAATGSGLAPTQIINEIAVNSSGQPANGYHETTGPTPDRAAECNEPSPAAVSNNIYGCAPSAYSADVCWPASGLDLLCMNDPWAKEVHRIHVPAPLNPVTAPVAPQPVALLLDDGTHCRIRNGGSWSGRDDGYLGAYRCDPNEAVLTRPNSEPIDRSTPLWTVKLGDLPGFGQPAQPPATHSVVTAWFASN
jgi:hypothetical protein